MLTLESLFRAEDCLAASTQKYKPMTIPILDGQKQLNDDYCDQIETLSCKLQDQVDANQILQDRIARLEQQNQVSQDRITSYQAAVNERSFAVARVTSLESDAIKLNADLKTEISNRDHFRALVVQQDAFIKEAKSRLEASKNELKSKTEGAEYLAKQVLRLNEENSKLRQENAETVFRNIVLNAQTLRLTEENCKMDKTLRVERSITSYKDTIIETLQKALYALKSMTCILWRKQAKIYRNCIFDCNVIRGNIDNIRENKIVPKDAT